MEFLKKIIMSLRLFFGQQFFEFFLTKKAIFEFLGAIPNCSRLVEAPTEAFRRGRCLHRQHEA